MKLKTILLAAVLALTTAVFAREVPWSDTHGLINTELAVKMNIDDPDILIRMAVNDFEGMKKRGLINAERCDMFKIDTHVDFCDYLYGYWDTSYAITKPGSDRAEREIQADKDAESAWNNILSTIKMHQEMSANSRYDKESGINMVKEYFAEMTSWRVVHDSSPQQRLLLPDRIAFVKKFLAN